MDSGLHCWSHGLGLGMESEDASHDPSRGQLGIPTLQHHGLVIFIGLTNHQSGGAIRRRVLWRCEQRKTHVMTWIEPDLFRLACTPQLSSE